MPQPSRTCALGASSKATYFLVSACYLKTFDSLALNNFFFEFYTIFNPFAPEPPVTTPADLRPFYRL